MRFINFFKNLFIYLFIYYYLMNSLDNFYFLSLIHLFLFYLAVRNGLGEKKTYVKKKISPIITPYCFLPP